MKLCIDCRHFTYRTLGIENWCGHPDLAVNPINGWPIVLAADARAESGVCSPSAKLFGFKPVRKPFAWLFCR